MTRGIPAPPDPISPPVPDAAAPSPCCGAPSYDLAEFGPILSEPIRICSQCQQWYRAERRAATGKTTRLR